MRVFIICSIYLFIDWCGAAVVLLNREGHIQSINVTGGIKKESLKSTNDGGLFNVVKSMVAIDEKQSERHGRHFCKNKKKKLKHKKHFKFLLPLLLGLIVIKLLLLPIVLKALALLSGKAIVLSLMSLILVAVLGLRRFVQTITGLGNAAGIDIGGNNRKGLLYGDEQDQLSPEEVGADPYGYYRPVDRRHSRK